MTSRHATAARLAGQCVRHYRPSTRTRRRVPPGPGLRNADELEIYLFSSRRRPQSAACTSAVGPGLRRPLAEPYLPALKPIVHARSTARGDACFSLTFCEEMRVGMPKVTYIEYMVPRHLVRGWRSAIFCDAGCRHNNVPGHRTRLRGKCSLRTCTSYVRPGLLHKNGTPVPGGGGLKGPSNAQLCAGGRFNSLLSCQIAMREEARRIGRPRMPAGPA